MWCVKCQRGIRGELGQECPECISRGDTNPGILKTPEQASEEHKAMARARKLASQNKNMKPYKSMDDIKKEAKQEAIDEIIKKIQSGEIKIPQVAKEEVKIAEEVKPISEKPRMGRPPKVTG